jgi:hypothetical protein
LLNELSRNYEPPASSRDPSRTAASLLALQTAQRRESARRLPADAASERDRRSAEISPASVVSVRVELLQRAAADASEGAAREVFAAPPREVAPVRPRAREVFPVAARESEPAKPAPNRPEPTNAAEFLPLAAAERAVAAYAFQRSQFEPALASPRPRLDVRA